MCYSASKLTLCCMLMVWRGWVNIYIQCLHRADVSSCFSANTDASMCGCPSKNILVRASPTCLVCMVFEIESKWQYSCCFLWCCFQNLFQKHVAFLCSSHLASSPCILWCIHPVVLTQLQLERNPILSDTSDFHMIDNLSIAVHTFVNFKRQCINKFLDWKFICLIAINSLLVI